MAFLFKAAEGILEDFDRRAKQVVGERSDHQSELQKQATEQEPFGRKSSQISKAKVASKSSGSKHSAKLDQFAKEEPETTRGEVQGKSHTEDISDLYNSTGQYQKTPSQEKKAVTNGSIDSTRRDPSPATLKDAETIDFPLTQGTRDKEDGHCIKEDIEVSLLSASTCEVQSSTPDIRSETSDANSMTSDHKPVTCNVLAENDTVSVELLPSKEPLAETAPKIIHVDLSENTGEVSNKASVEESSVTDISSESLTSKVKVNETLKSLPTKDEDQLNEAQGLLKTAASTGQSKEARLARVCAGLSARLQEYKTENAQLEELLSVEREERKALDSHLYRLEEEVQLAKAASRSAEVEMANALASKNAEIESLTKTVETLKKQVAVSEEELSALQANTEALIKNRELSETRLIQALREDVDLAQQRLDQEIAAHNKTRMAAMERESQQKQNMVESSAALAKAQRTIDEKSDRISFLEQKVSTLEMECATLNQELQELEARFRREQRKPAEDANLTSQLMAWQEKAERAQQVQREVEDRLSSVNAENQKLRVELSAMKRDAEQYSKEAHIELEKRYRELTDLLYKKQTQLEATISEKAAAVFQLEKEGKRLKELQMEAERNKVSRRLSSPWDEEEGELKPLDSLPLHHRQMVGSGIRKAARILDSGTVSAARFLWRHPLARLIFAFYLVFVHLFLLYLLHHLQEQADSLLSSKEAAAMGLLKP